MWRMNAAHWTCSKRDTASKQNTSSWNPPLPFYRCSFSPRDFFIDIPQFYYSSSRQNRHREGWSLFIQRISYHYVVFSCQTNIFLVVILLYLQCLSQVQQRSKEVRSIIIVRNERNAKNAGQGCTILYRTSFRSTTLHIRFLIRRVSQNWFWLFYLNDCMPRYLLL
jgi:hypothetical protein